jgi:anti-anti-sigma factor
MLNSFFNISMKKNRPATTSEYEGAQPPLNGNTQLSSGWPQAVNLLITTTHPESADQWAGEVVGVPAEFKEGTVLVDLNELTTIDSWGLAIFMEAMRRITARGGNLVLIRIHDNVRRVLETAKLDNISQMFSTREEALAKHGRLFRAGKDFPRRTDELPFDNRIVNPG